MAPIRVAQTVSKLKNLGGLQGTPATGPEALLSRTSWREMDSILKKLPAWGEILGRLRKK